MIESIQSLSPRALRRYKVAKFLQRYALYIILIFLVLIFAIMTNGVTVKPTNLLNIVKNTTPVALIAMGVTMIIITMGIDLSSGSVLALSAIISASLARTSAEGVSSTFTGLPFFIPVFVGLAVGALAGCINGLFITKTKIPPFIATLGMMTSARGLALMVSNGRSISGLHPGFKFIGQGHILAIPVPIWILAVMFVITHVILSSTRVGRYAYAIGGNLRAAQVSGINTDSYLVVIYTYAGFLAGMAGLITVGLINSAQPILGILYELDAIASSVIGGTSLSGGIGNIPGALIGALFVGVLKNGMDLQYVSAYWQDIVRGVVIILAVVLDTQKQKLSRN